MRYSLLSRFRGSLLGSLLGEILVSRSQDSCDSSFLISCPKDSSSVAALMTTQSNWSKVVTSGINSLIQLGRLELKDWQIDSSASDLVKNTVNSSEAALAMLPIALFFHDDQLKLRQQLLAAADWYQVESEAILVAGYAIAFAITETVNPQNLIPKILASLGTTQSAIGQQLQQVQSLIEASVPVEIAVNQLYLSSKQPANSIALALYCFLSTPEDFQISISRTRHISNKFPLVAPLTGAISGAYNSNVGIPVSWRLAANKINLNSDKQQLAERLFAVWSGAYDISVIESFDWAAIAAPRVIGFR